jgi:hypothetical protein
MDILRAEHQNVLMKQCQGEVLIVFLQAPGLVGEKTKKNDKTLKQLANDFKMTDIKSTREGEHQTGYLTKYGPTEKNVENVPDVPREARPGDAAVWGGGFQNLNMQSILAGKAVQSIKGEAVGLSPSQAGITRGPVIDPKATMRDHENLKIKP